MKTLIKDARVVLPRETVKTNILIEGSKIISVDAPSNATADEIVDAEGQVLMPGVIDDQVHLRDPGLTHKEDLRTGSMAAAKGGVTSFLEMPNTKPAAVTQDLILQKLAIAGEKSIVNYGFFIGATPDNTADLATATRVPGIKIFIGSSTGNLLVDEQEALERIFAETTLPICAHCEDEATVRANAEALDGGKSFADHSRIRDEAAAAIATRRSVDLAHRHTHRFHVLHVSTAAEIPLITDHRNLITAEVCPHHLFFSVDDYDRLGSLVQMNPSVKTKADNAGLWQALLDNKIQVVATDHAPHTLEEKQLPYPQSPSGVPALENYLALMLNEVNNGRCTLQQLARWMSDAPARVWDMVGKGRIQVGYDADLVLVDMEKVGTIRNADQVTKSKWSPWDGVMLKGWPVRTWVRGHTVYRDGKFDLTKPGGEIQYDHVRGGYWSTQDT